MMNKTIQILCANDSMELAFMPNTDAAVIESEKQKLQIEFKDKVSKREMRSLPYIHVHTVICYQE